MTACLASMATLERRSATSQQRQLTGPVRLESRHQKHLTASRVDVQQVVQFQVRPARGSTCGVWRPIAKLSPRAGSIEREAQELPATLQRPG